MESAFSPVRHARLPHSIVLRYPEYNPLGRVSWSDNAILVMTDFSRMTPFSVDPQAALDTAHERMRACGVRLLFVVDNDRVVLGLITAADLLGEKPVQYLREVGGARTHIRVENIMTPIEQLQAVELADVLASRVGNIVETIRLFNRQHLLVMESGQKEIATVRGMFSATQISRQIGAEISFVSETLDRPNRAAAFS